MAKNPLVKTRPKGPLPKGSKIFPEAKKPKGEK